MFEIKFKTRNHGPGFLIGLRNCLFAIGGAVALVLARATDAVAAFGAKVFTPLGLHVKTHIDSWPSAYASSIVQSAIFDCHKPGAAFFIFNMLAIINMH